MHTQRPISRDKGDHIKGPTASPAIAAEIYVFRWYRGARKSGWYHSTTYAVTDIQRGLMVNLCLCDEASTVCHSYRRACVGGDGDGAQNKTFLVDRPVLQRDISEWT
jgi:hypothetical protein